MNKFYSIAIDGPAGAGKSTIAKKIAKKLNYIYVDTGAMYRAFALLCLRENVLLEESEELLRLTSEVDIVIEYDNHEQQVLLNGENVTSLIRTSEVGQMASTISVYKPIRLKLVELQKKLSKKANIIMDGRDIGTYVLPDADLKIFLTASVKERAKRRWQELRAKGESFPIEFIEEEIRERDSRDMNRTFAPLKKAEDAIEIDTSAMTIDEVVEKIIYLFYQVKDEHQ